MTHTPLQGGSGGRGVRHEMVPPRLFRTTRSQAPNTRSKAWARGFGNFLGTFGRTRTTFRHFSPKNHGILEKIRQIFRESLGKSPRRIRKSVRQQRRPRQNSATSCKNSGKKSLHNLKDARSCHPHLYQYRHLRSAEVVEIQCLIQSFVRTPSG